MKYLNWLKDNINVISMLVGIGCVISGKAEIGRILISGGGL